MKIRENFAQALRRKAVVILTITLTLDKRLLQQQREREREWRDFYVINLKRTRAKQGSYLYIENSKSDFKFETRALLFSKATIFPCRLI